MSKSQSIIKRVLALLLVTVFVTAIPLSVSADTITVTLDQCIDSNGKYITYAQNAYNSEGTLVCKNGGAVYKIYYTVDTASNLAYCIQPGGRLNTGNILNSDYQTVWDSFSKELKKSINIALLYGLNGSTEKLIVNTDEKYIATQLIIWELIDGYRHRDHRKFCVKENNELPFKQ